MTERDQAASVAVTAAEQAPSGLPLGRASESSKGAPDLGNPVQGQRSSSEAPPVPALAGNTVAALLARRMQAKDIDDLAFLLVVDRLSKDQTYHRWVMRYEVEQEFPHAHWKVLLAKAKALGRRGLLDGCFCTCRGDYELTPAGHDFLAEQAERSQGGRHV